MMFDVLDLQPPADMKTIYKSAEDGTLNELFGHCRLNLNFMWQCVASVADFTGESYLARLYWILAVESRFMLEELTPQSFSLFAHAEWEATTKGTLLKLFQSFALEVLWFGKTILAVAGESMHRHAYVSESIVVAVVLVLMINFVIWLYMVPMMATWTLPILKFKKVNMFVFPSYCRAGF